MLSRSHQIQNTMQLQLLMIYMMIAIAVSDTANDCLQIHKLQHAELESLSPNTPAAKIAQNIKCYAKCLLRDYMGEDDKLSLQLIGDKVSPLDKAAIQSCMFQHDKMSTSAPCDYGYLILQCLTLKS